MVADRTLNVCGVSGTLSPQPLRSLATRHHGRGYQLTDAVARSIRVRCCMRGGPMRFLHALVQARVSTLPFNGLRRSTNSRCVYFIFLYFYFARLYFGLVGPIILFLSIAPCEVKLIIYTVFDRDDLRAFWPSLKYTMFKLLFPINIEPLAILFCILNIRLVRCVSYI